MLTIGSLYSGVGGLELGLLAAFTEVGIESRVAWQVEIDPFASRVLAHHFPDTQRFSDVATVSHPPTVDVLCGGFACQDVSSAGKGRGLGRETRSGHTLHHLLRLVDEIVPPYVVIENVASGAKRWLPRVVQELVDRGYRPRAVPLGAIDVGAPHRRLRVFVVADRASKRSERSVNRGERTGRDHAGRGGAGVADPGLTRLEIGSEQLAWAELAPAERGGRARGTGLAHADDQAIAGGDERERARRVATGPRGSSERGATGTPMAHPDGATSGRLGGILDREREALGDDADRRGGQARSDGRASVCDPSRSGRRKRPRKKALDSRPKRRWWAPWSKRVGLKPVGEQLLLGDA